MKTIKHSGIIKREYVDQNVSQMVRNITSEVLSQYDLVEYVDEVENIVVITKDLVYFDTLNSGKMNQFDCSECHVVVKLKGDKNRYNIYFSIFEGDEDLTISFDFYMIEV